MKWISGRWHLWLFIKWKQRIWHFIALCEQSFLVSTSAPSIELNYYISKVNLFSSENGFSVLKSVFFLISNNLNWKRYEKLPHKIMELKEFVSIELKQSCVLFANCHSLNDLICELFGASSDSKWTRSYPMFASVCVKRTIHSPMKVILVFSFSQIPEKVTFYQQMCSWNKMCFLNQKHKLWFS